MKIIDYSLNNLIGLLSIIKGKEVLNEKQGYSFTNYKLPILKYDNITNNVPVFKVEEIEEEFAIVGTRVISLNAGAYGTENGFAGQLVIVPLSVISKYFESFKLKESSLSFYSYSSGDFSIIENSVKKTFNKILKTFKDLYGNDRLKEFKKSLPNSFEKSEYVFNDFDLKKGFREINDIDFDFKYGEKDNICLTVTIYGKDNLETRNNVKIAIKKFEKKYNCVAIGMDRQGMSGSDWNSRCWKEGGYFTIMFSPK